MYVTYVLHLAILAILLPVAQNYETKYSKANIPLWRQRACEKAQQKGSSHYICDDKGDVKCLPGWQGDLCQVPMCRKGCDPMNGYCQRPGECRCRIGYTGDSCEKCIALPGCQHGDCKKPFECICRSGWDGLFCTEPTCRQGCHSTRGYCEGPGECRCRIGWAGRNCSDCAIMPGCQHGTCNKPLECNCLPGYTGILCQIPLCHADCHKQHGYCKKPGECRCKVGWTGANCDQCFPYPGCAHGDCQKPWDCNCKAGWGGILCDEALSYCKENPNTCENGGRCISLTKEDGNFHCQCKQGYLGKNCEIVDEFMLTSTSAPRITPPPPLEWEEDEDQDINENLINEVTVQNKTQLLKGKVNNDTEIKKNVTNSKNSTTIKTLELDKTMASTTLASIEKIDTKATHLPLVFPTTVSAPTLVKKDLQDLANISGSDIIGTATMIMEHVDKVDSKSDNKVEASKTKVADKTKINLTNIVQVNNTLASNNLSVNTNNETKLTTTTTTLPPSIENDEQKQQPSKPTKSAQKQQDIKVETTTETSDDDDEDEECNEDNDDECEYEDEEEEEEDGDKK